MLQQRGTVTFNEIMEQPVVWREVIAHMENLKADITGWLKSESFGQIIFTGCGSSYFLADMASRMISVTTGIPSRAFASSDLFFYRKPPYDARIKALIVAISRSGETSETVWAVEKIAALDPRAKVLSVTCSEDNPLARISQKILAFPKAKEEGPIVTKCFTSFLVALTMLVAWYSGSESLVEDLRKAADLFDIKKHQNELQRLASQKFTIYSSLGTGFYLGLAGETDLKIREMGLSPCGYYNTMEFRHGAFCTVNNTYFFICFLSEALKKAEIEAIREFTSLKSQRLLICEEADDRTKMSVEYLIELKSGLSEYARLPLMVPIAQLFAFYQSISKGMNPDKPKYLNPVVILKDRV